MARARQHRPERWRVSGRLFRYKVLLFSFFFIQSAPRVDFFSLTPTKKKKTTSALSCCCSLLLLSTARAASPAPPAPPPPCPSLLDRVRADSSLSGFLSVLEGVGYQTALGASGGGGGLGVTLLAPTNDALAAPLPRSSGSSGDKSNNNSSNNKVSFNSSNALFSAVPAAARAAVGGHFLKGFVARSPADFQQQRGKWLGTLATSKRPGERDRALGVEVVGVEGGGGGSAPFRVMLRGDGGTTAAASFVDDYGAKGCGDGLLKLDGVLWPFKF